MLRHRGGLSLRLYCAEQEALMNGLYLLGGLLAIGLLIYLITALLFPEDFS